MKSKVFLDCCVLMDFFQGREKALSAESILALAERGEIRCYSSSLVFCTLSYLFERYKIFSRKDIPEVLGELMKVVEILPVSSDDIAYAVEISKGDFEDAVEYSVAKRHCDYVVTDNITDFLRISNKLIITPEDFLARSVWQEVQC